jgi:YVTN family beta-propeller protein
MDKPTDTSARASARLLAATIAVSSLVGEVHVSPRSHDTDIGISGQYAYIETKSSNTLAVIDTKTDAVVRHIGPFRAFWGRMR